MTVRALRAGYRLQLQVMRADPDTSCPENRGNFTTGTSPAYLRIWVRESPVDERKGAAEARRSQQLSIRKGPVNYPPWMAHLTPADEAELEARIKEEISGDDVAHAAALKSSGERSGLT